MGYAVAAAGHPGMTGRLEVRYRATVPLGQPLRLQARLVDVLGEAEGRFLALRPEQATRLFGGTTEPTR